MSFCIWGCGNSSSLLLVDVVGTFTSEVFGSSDVTDGIFSVTETLRICFLKCIFAKLVFNLVEEETDVSVCVSAVDAGTKGVWFCSVLMSVFFPALSKVDCDKAACGSDTDLSGLVGIKNGLCRGFFVCEKLKDTF